MSESENSQCKASDNSFQENSNVKVLAYTFLAVELRTELACNNGILGKDDEKDKKNSKEQHVHHKASHHHSIHNQEMCKADGNRQHDYVS